MAAAATSAADSSHQDPPPSLTDTDIITLAQQNHLHPSFLSPSSHPNLLSYLHTRSRSPNSSAAVSDYTLALLSLISLSPEKPSLSSLLSSLLSAYTDLFISSQIPHDRNSLRTINLFISLLNYVNVNDLESIVESVVDNLSKLVDSEDTQILDVLPGCFRGLAGEKGRECVSLILGRVIDSPWSKGVLVKMVFLAREFLGFLRGREFLEKVFKGMKGVDLQDLPSLTYQLLVLASRGFSKVEVIQGIVSFFGFELGSKAKASSTLRQVEGTVLLHINFAVKQDPSLAKEVIGMVKLNPRAVNHFTVAILLSVARVRRFSDSSIGVLKAALLTAYRDYRFSRNCMWLPDELKEEYLLNVQIAEKAILRAINESNYGREHIVPSIVKFSFALLESSEGVNHEELCNSNGLLGVEALSVQILKTLFEVHDMSRNEIIEQCKFRILSLKPEQSIPIIRLLCFLVKSYPYPMLEHVSRLKELLDYFTFMHGNVSSYLVAALVPLIKFNRDLRDYTILVVRKAMFRQEETIRLAATNAIISIVLAEKQSNSSLAFQDSSSQASSSQQAEILGIYGGGLFQELSCLLQRCFYQQAKVKEAMYYGLLKLVLVDPASGRAAFDFLLPHFVKFFKEDADVQLGISSCIKSEGDNSVIEEPLDCLLSCVSWILLLQPHDKADHPDSSWACFGFSLTQENEAGRNLSSESFSKSLSKIREFLKNPRLEGILSSTQDSAATPVEHKKRKCFASVLSGIIEVVLNIIASELEKAADLKRIDLEKEILELVNFHHSFEKFTSIKKSCGVKRGNPLANALDTPISKLPHEQIPFLSTSSLCLLLQSEINRYSSDSSKGLKASQKNSQLSSRERSNCFRSISFVLNKCIHQIRSYPIERKDDPVKNLVYGDIKLMGTPFMNLICLLSSGVKCSTSQTKETKGKKDFEDSREHLRLALLCLKELVTNSSKNNSLSSGFLEDLLSVSTLEYESDEECEEASRIDDQHIRMKVSFLVKFLKPLFNHLLAKSFFHEIEIVCDMMAIIGDKLPCKWRNSNGSWCIHACKTNDIKDPKAARSIIELAISLTSAPDDLVVARYMAKELLDVIGYAETDEDGNRKKPLEMSELYPIINKSTSTAISSCILKLVEEVIVDTDWSIKKLKTSFLAEQKNICFSQNGEHAFGLAAEDNLYLRTEAVVKVLSSFVLMNLNDTQAEHLLRLNAKLYKHLAQLSRLRIAPKGCKQLLPSPTFQGLVESTCKELTAPLYKFIAEMQSNQQKNPSTRGIINKIKRENKCIPDLIFQIEDYEKFLIRLSKVCKINLLKYAKRSTSRDFRILDPNKNKEDAPPIPNPGGHNNNEEEAHVVNVERSQEEPENNDGNDEDNVLSPGNDSLIAEDSDSEHVACDLPNGKRLKRDRVVMDSDEEA
ncbi:Fanconi anemia group I protein [Euphorbia peplus]|nr:Fanconi anemia group I protein [Euphorbia peplus]